MNLLIDLVSTTVEIEGVEYEINSDFRTSILFELMMQDSTIGEKEKILMALELYYPEIPKNINEAIDKILWFYRCGKNITSQKGTGKDREATQIYSFEYDDDYIYSAFLDQYGVDLQDIEYLHWWKFKAMFKSLKEDNEFVKIMRYRAMNITKDMSKEQREFYTKMKKLHEIPISKSEREKINEIEKALLGSGDLSGIS